MSGGQLSGDQSSRYYINVPIAVPFEDTIMFLSKVRKMGLAPHPKWFFANFSKISQKVKIIGHMLINNVYIYMYKYMQLRLSLF